MGSGGDIPEFLGYLGEGYAGTFVRAGGGYAGTFVGSGGSMPELFRA